MSQATATRLGSSPVRLDWTGLASSPTKPGPMTALSRTSNEAWDHLCGLFLSDQVGFYAAPTKDELSQLKASKILAADLCTQKNITDVLFLGIGGSALGPICVLSALEHRRKT
ncbi:MAG: hypothetical protein KGQ59_06430, partial [Bdellovibrionales bacterium]|nr:hypothetical protein [Bdellovibrionales bacterium]